MTGRLCVFVCALSAGQAKDLEILDLEKTKVYWTRATKAHFSPPTRITEIKTNKKHFQNLKRSFCSIWHKAVVEEFRYNEREASLRWFEKFVYDVKTDMEHF